LLIVVELSAGFVFKSCQSVLVIRRGTSPISMFVGGIGGIILGVAFKYRLLPFLKPDTILSGGKQVPTEQFANFAANIFFVFAAVCLVASTIWFIARKPR